MGSIAIRKNFKHKYKLENASKMKNKKIITRFLTSCCLPIFLVLRNIALFLHENEYRVTFISLFIVLLFCFALISPLWRSSRRENFLYLLTFVFEIIAKLTQLRFLFLLGAGLMFFFILHSLKNKTFLE